MHKQECATRCFAQFGGPKLDAWLTCTLEDHECVKIPKDLDFSAIDRNPPATLKGFEPAALQGVWYKVRESQSLAVPICVLICAGTVAVLIADKVMRPPVEAYVLLETYAQFAALFSDPELDSMARLHA